MKTPKIVKRYRLLIGLSKKMLWIDQMGRYRFVGEWGDKTLKQYTKLVRLYNKHRFWWQTKIRIS